MQEGSRFASAKLARLALSAMPAVLIAARAAIVVLQLSVLAIRINSTVLQGALSARTGEEGVVIYPIWKLVQGYPLYEWPNRFPFSSTPYNFLFFYVYAIDR